MLILSKKFNPRRKHKDTLMQHGTTDGNQIDQICAELIEGVEKNCIKKYMTWLSGKNLGNR